MTLSFLSNSIHLVAITPDGPLTGRNFGGDHAGAIEWARAQTGANVYFTVNEVSPTFTGTKPTKADITRARFAHVDIDPPESGEWDRDAALLALMAQNPTVIIDSGNGWQGLWALTHHTDDIETINRGIAHALGADPRIHNIDRLFRVPDTTNWPNAVKRAKGRAPQPTALILYDPSLTYSPEVLLAHYPAPVRAARSVAEGVYDGPYEEDYDPPLPSNELRDLLWADIAPGSRSEHAARVAHRMGREGYSYPQILGALLNPQWPWAGTIQDQADPERQARRKLAGVVVWPKGEDMFPDDEPRSATVVEPPTVTRARAIGMAPRANGGFMGAGEQVDHFAGCVYVTSLDRILMPNGTMLNQSRFDAVMGGYLFALDANNEKTTKSAWEAFLKGHNFRPPIADERCFRPMLPSMSLIEDGNRTLVNCYVPIDTPRVEGDVSPFMDWLARAYPDARDRAILLNYMASLVRNPGVKFFWWPVLQSAEGTGKGFIMSLLMYCVGRQYSHLPNTSKLTRKGMDFNGWIENKLFLGLNEIYSAKRRDFLEELKTTVTDSVIPIEGKGIEEATLDNYANGVLFTNHPDGVPITVDMRRYCILYMALQTKEDILRAGMDAKYFKRYWDWVNGRGEWAEHGADYGYRAMNHYLRTMELDPTLDPANLATTAPRTSSTDRAIRESLGKAEQEVVEAIDQEQPGFKGGWVSSLMLDRVLKDVGANVPRNKRKDMMKALGFHYHPGLHEGRVNNPVLPDGGKPRLYIRIGHEHEGLVGPTVIADQYMKDQGA